MTVNSAETAHAISVTLKVVRDSLESIAKALSPDPDWPKATCGECGWCLPWGDGSSGKADCRRVAFGGGEDAYVGEIKIADKACPGFIRRPVDNPK